MAKKKKAPSPRMNEAASVAANIQIRRIQLMDLRASTPIIHLDEGCEIEVEVSTSTCARIEGELLHVIADCELQGNNGDETIIAISAKFNLEYDLKPGFEPTQSQIDSFGDINGIFNLWPFLRELVVNLTVRMGFPALTIPVRRVSRSG